MPQRFATGTGSVVAKHRELKKSKLASAVKAAANIDVFAQGEVGCRPVVENLEARQLLSSTWFVSPSGNNNNAGSISAPFQTIQQAANIAQAGDHVEIETGVYHETVTVPHSGTASAPIVFEAYNGENVTISGADPITNWSVSSGNVYSAAMPLDLGEGNNEVFVNGSAINEAVFPNTAVGDFSHPGTITPSSVKGNTIYSSALNQPTNTWKGAIIHFAPGQGWDGETGTVTSSAPGSITISYANNTPQYDTLNAGNKFYLFGKFAALDSAGEWYRDPTSGRLYAWMPNSGNPNTQDVEVKKRQFAFVLDKAHDITIQGVKIFSASISTSATSVDTKINNITAQYISQQLQIPHGWWQLSRSGIYLNGAHSIFENSTIAYSAVEGISVNAPYCLIENNVIRDCDYTAANVGSITLNAAYPTVDHNTIYNSGRHGILTEVAHASITYNTIHDVSLQTTEGGGIYTANTNGQGSTMAYNYIYNMHAPGYGATALFIDNNTDGWNVHNNVTSNVDYGLKLNFTETANNIYNNTLGATILSINSNQKGSLAGVKIYNNVFLKGTVITSGATLYNNVYSASSSSSMGAGDFSSGASGTPVVTPPPVVVTPPVTTPPVTTPPVTTPPVTTPPVTTPPVTTTTPLATAKTLATSYTLQSGTKADGFGGIGSTDNNDYLAYKLDFGTGMKSVTVAATGIYAGGTIEFHLGSATGTLVGTLKLAVTGSWSKYTNQSTSITGVSGVQTIYLVFKGTQSGISNVDSITFSASSTASTTPTTTPLATAKTMAVNCTAQSGTLADGYGGIGSTDTNDYVAYKLDFGTGVKTLTAQIAAMYTGGSIQIRLGSPTGTLVGTLNIAVSGGWNKYTSQSAAVSGLTGVQTVYLVFKGTRAGIGNIDSLTFA